MKKTIRTDEAPAAIGPYSQAVSAGGLVFCSGQIPLDPQSGELVSGEIEAETERVMLNLQAVLAAAGSDWAHVLKCNIFLTDLGDFARVNEVYGRFFDEQPPARACVEVAGLPRGARIEIEAIASLV